MWAHDRGYIIRTLLLLLLYSVSVAAVCLFALVNAAHHTHKTILLNARGHFAAWWIFRKLCIVGGAPFCLSADLFTLSAGHNIVCTVVPRTDVLIKRRTLIRTVWLDQRRRRSRYMVSRTAAALYKGGPLAVVSTPYEIRYRNIFRIHSFWEYRFSNQASNKSNRSDACLKAIWRM